MSTATSRLRRVGVGGLATALVLGTALTGADTANASAEAASVVTATPTTGQPGTTIPAPSVTVAEEAEGAIVDDITFTLSDGAWATAGALTTPAGVTVTSSAISTSDPRELTFTLNNTTTTPGTFTLADANIKLPNSHAAITVSADGLGSVPYASAIEQARIFGADRYETAAAAFRAFDEFKTSAVLATGVNFPDALAANALAGDQDTGVLLTRTNSLPPATREALLDALREWGPIEPFYVYVVGGESAISQAVVEEIQNLGLQARVGEDEPIQVEVIRVSGSDRMKTAEAVATYVGPDGDVRVNTMMGQTAVVASGWNYPDALAIGPASYAYDMPLFLTQRNGTLSDSTLDALDASGVTNVVIVGGENAVPAAVETQLEAQYNVLRLWGGDRYATAAAIANWELTEDATIGGLGWEHYAGLDHTAAYLTTGNNFPDALAGGPVAGYNNSPLLLVPLSVGETNVLTEYTADIFSSVTAFGGPSIVSNDVLTIAAVATAGVPNQPVSP